MKWCEVIRTQLEKCSAEEEIEKCISNYGTGAKIPSMKIDFFLHSIINYSFVLIFFSYKRLCRRGNERI